MQLRSYQTECINAILAKEQKINVVKLPTGAGKTIIFCSLATHFNKVLIVVSKNVLVTQTIDKLSNFVPRGTISIYNAGLRSKDFTGKYVVSSVQSLLKLTDLPKFDLIIIDEYHVKFDFFNQLEQQTDKIVGFSATPSEEDEKYIVYEKSLKWAIDNNFLVPFKIVTRLVNFDKSKLKIVANDYTASSSTELLIKYADEHIETAKQLIKKYNKKKIAWICSSIKHAKLISDRLGRDKSVLYTSQDDGNIKSFEEGNIKHLVSVMKVSVGYDYPALDTVIILRPTRSKMLFVQMIGRALRKFSGKRNALIVDFGQCTEELGNPLYINHFGSVKKKEEEKEELKLCYNCNTVLDKKETVCPECGSKFIRICPYCMNVLQEGQVCSCVEERRKERLLDTLKKLKLQAIAEDLKTQRFHVISANKYRNVKGNIVLKVNYSGNLREFFVLNKAFSRKKFEMIFTELAIKEDLEKMSIYSSKEFYVSGLLVYKRKGNFIETKKVHKL